MINLTLSSLRNNDFLNLKEIATIVNGRKKETIGYFIPEIFRKEFEQFRKKLQEKQKISILKKIANASKLDIIGDGSVDDDIK